MSSRTYTKMWLESQASLKDLLGQELPSQPLQTEKDRRLLFHMLATLFLRYTQILRSLETCYDQIVHPQKRLVLQHVLDGVMGRVLELKNEMVETELSEYHYMDDVLQDLKLTPADMEVPIPKYFVNQRAKALKERQQVLSKILTRVEPSVPPGPPRPAMLQGEAVQAVQMAERMRQGCLRATFMREIRRDEERARRARESGAKELDREQAAICIQKLHHRRARRAPVRSLWSRRAHRGHHCRPAPRRSTNQPQDGADGGATTRGRPRTPSCSRPSGISWRCQSGACGWRSGGWSSRSERWPGARRHGGPSCAHLSAQRNTWPPMPRRPLLCPPCPPLHPPLQLLSHRRPPPWGLPPRGTWGLLTPAGHTCWFAQPPASLGQGSGRGEG